MDLLPTRPLRQPDILRLAAPRATKPEPIVKVSHRHHALARCLAIGMSPADASQSTGYSLSRISILAQDDMFKELVELYRSEVQSSFKANADQLAGLTSEALAALRERLEATPEKISTRDLVELAKLGADRSGHGPTSTQQTQISVDLSERLRAARARVIEHEEIT